MAVSPTPFEFQTRKLDRFKRLKNGRVLLANSLQGSPRLLPRSEMGRSRLGAQHRRLALSRWLVRHYRIRQQYPVVFFTCGAAAFGTCHWGKACWDALFGGWMPAAAFRTVPV